MAELPQVSGRRAPQPGQGWPRPQRADYVWCKTALEWAIRSGQPRSHEEVAARLIQESEKARKRHEDGDDYAMQTVRSAAAAIERESAQAR